MRAFAFSEGRGYVEHAHLVKQHGHDPARRAAIGDINGRVAKDHRPRLRAAPLARPFHVVLVDPEIPQNTGNIARLCAATASRLHLVGRLGFRIDEKSVRRAGVDYWHLVDIEQHLSLSHFRNAHPEARLWLMSAVATRSYLEAPFEPGDALVFGKESTGLDEDLLAAHAEACLAVPTLGPVRSLNLANAAGIVLFEALRQVGAFERTSLEAL